MTDAEWYNFREKCPWRSRNIFTEQMCINGNRCLRKQDCGLIYAIDFIHKKEKAKWVENQEGNIKIEEINNG